MKTVALVTIALVVVGVWATSRQGEDVRRADEVYLPESDDTFFSVHRGTPAADLVQLVDVGLSPKEKGPDATFFVVIRSGDRHAPNIRDAEFHVVVGAGVRLPKGSMRIRRKWIASGMIDGTNEEFQTLSVAVMVERGAPRPFEPDVVAAVVAFCEALTARVPIHPDCIASMGEVPYTNDHPADADEAALAAAARARVPVPLTDGEATIRTRGGTIEVTYEKRETTNARRVGMMMRKQFDETNRGMLFIYPHRGYRRFFMRNCFIPIDVAYIRDGRIEEIITMKPEAESDPRGLPHYPSAAAVKYCLEMPGGWFDHNGIAKGDLIELR